MPNIMQLFTVPFLSALIVFLYSSISEKNLKRLAAVLSLLPLLFLIVHPTSWIGSHIDYPWLPALDIHFHLGIDGVTLLFLYLTALVIPLAIFAVRSQDLPSPHLFYGLVLLVQGLLIGFFMARDLALFTIFWEGMLVPLYFLIHLWGGPKRQQAAIQFIIYMLAGSAFMVAAVLALYFTSTSGGQGTFDLEALAPIAAQAPYAGWLFAIFLLAFAVKTPLFPFHAWLPDTYTQASTTGTILLSALLSKAGIYGIFRIGIGFFAPFMQAWSFVLITLAVIGVLYGGLAAWRQTDFKRLIAYSSLSHVNFILAGLFVWNATAQTGALLQAFNHGITITALFLAAAWLAQRIGSTDMNAGSGLAKYAPHLCWVTLFFVLSSIALPGLNNFIGEVLILFGLFGTYPWLTFLLGLTVILSVMYMLRWMQTMYFEEPTLQAQWPDMTRKEWIISLPLIILIIWIGIYPMPVLKQIEPQSEKIIAETLQ